MQIEIRSDKITIDGYVNAVGRDSRPIRCQTGSFIEQVEPGAFGKALKRAKNVKLLLNHRNDRELGSLAQGNLTLAEDNIGLKAHAEVTDEEIIRKARSNQLSGWSFGMYVNECEMEERSNAIPRRRLKDIDVFEVSIIDNTLMPCYAGTSVECRAEGENALLETRSFEDTVEIKAEASPESYFEKLKERAAKLHAECKMLDLKKRIAELRYNAYHDPKSGKFTYSKEKSFKGVDKSPQNDIIKSGEGSYISKDNKDSFSPSRSFSSKKYDIHINGNHKPIKVADSDRRILYHHFNSIYHNLNSNSISHGVLYGDHLWLFDSTDIGSYLIWGKINIEKNHEIIEAVRKEYGINE